MAYLRHYSATRNANRPRVVKYEMYTNELRMGDACCAACASGKPCTGGPRGGLGALPVDNSTLETNVAAIQKSAQDYVTMDRDYRRLQIIATLAIPLAAMLTKAIFHWRKGTPLL